MSVFCNEHHLGAILGVALAGAKFKNNFWNNKVLPKINHLKVKSIKYKNFDGMKKDWF